MEIELSDDKYQKLTVVAQAAGYDDALTFVEALAEEATEDPRGRLSEAELRTSAAECDAIAERMKAGQEHDARKALTKLGEKFGLKTPQ
jgi:hypothetical protein